MITTHDIKAAYPNIQSCRFIKRTGRKEYLRVEAKSSDYSFFVHEFKSFLRLHWPRAYHTSGSPYSATYRLNPTPDESFA